MLSHACDAGAANGCTALGRLDERVDRHNRTVAASKFRRACELGDPEGCEALAVFQEHSEIGDEKSTVDEAYSRACRGGRLGSCHRLALRGLEDPATRERSVQLLIDNCSSGFAPSCNLAAMRYAPLLSAAASCERAIPLAGRACTAGDSLGCVLVDACQLRTPPNRAAALERLRSACEADQPSACLYWGDAQEGEPARDDKRIRRAYGMACARRESPGAWLACARADAFDLAHATSHLEADRAIEHLRDQCVAESAPACCSLADEYQSGKWVPADPSRTAELRQRACKLGERRCCDPGAQ